MLALASLRGRRASFTGTFAAVALGAALLTMTLLVFASSQPAVPDRLARADVIVHGPLHDGGDRQYARPWPSEIAESLAQRLRSTDGVTTAVADRTFYAQAVKDGPVDGHGWASLPLGGYELRSGRAPTGEHEVAVAGHQAGTVLDVLFAHGARPMTVTGTVDGPGIYVSDGLAAKLAPGVTAIGLITNGSANLSNVDLAGGAAASGGDRAIFESRERSSTRWLGAQLLVAMALLGSFVTVFIVASTFALNAAQRRRELGLLRTVGATPAQVRRLVLGEALLVGIIASLAGSFAGALTAPGFGRLLVRWGLENPDFGVSFALWPVAVAVAAATLTGVAGAWPASRRAARTSPMEALQEAAVEKRAMSPSRWTFGLLALAGGVTLAVATSSAEAEDQVNYSLLTAMALIVAAALLAPVLIKPLVRLVTAPFTRSRGAGGMLLRAETLNATGRAAAAAAPIIATIGFAALLTGMVQTMSVAYPAGKSASLAGLTIAVPDGTPGIPEETVLATGGDSTLPVRVFSAGRAYRTAGSGSAVASSEHVIGSDLDVTFSDGTTHRLRVTSAETGDHELILPRSLVRAHDLSALAPLVIGASGGGPGARLTDAKEYADLEYSEDTRLLWLFTLVLVGLSVGYTGISVLNTMAMASSGRRTDFAVLRKTGATVRQILTLTAAETILTVAIGVLLGLAVTLPALAGMSAGLTEEMGVPVALRLHWPWLLAVCAACLTLATAASTLTTHRLLRRL
jgi:putative ABC transport system permease protein